MSINLYVLLDTSIDSTNSTKLNIEELKKNGMVNKFSAICVHLLNHDFLIQSLIFKTFN